jgi:hypothetical protein
MWKYRSQTAISIVGLAVGFTCFALSALWIRYETSFDSFWKDADRTFVVNSSDDWHFGLTQRNLLDKLAPYLVETFPEVEAATCISLHNKARKFIIDGNKTEAYAISVDSAFFDFFGVKIIEGTNDFLNPHTKNYYAAVGQDAARKYWGEENPIGKKVELFDDEYTVCAIVSQIPERSNFRYDFMVTNREVVISSLKIEFGGNIIFKLKANADVEAFRKKLTEHKFTVFQMPPDINFTPITKMRYKDLPAAFSTDRDIQFHQVRLFAVTGLLVILCTLFNYLSLFVARFKIRQRELALRIVHGASNFSLLMLLATEFLISLGIALFLSIMIIESVFKEFINLSGITMDLPSIWTESTFYILAVSIILFLVLAVVTTILRRRTLNVAIRRGSGKRFRQISVVVQLIISIGFAFCTSVIIIQMYYLHNTADLGFEWKNRGSVDFEYVGGGETAMANKIKELPEIEKALKGAVGLLPETMLSSRPINSWEDKADDKVMNNIICKYITDEYVDFYNLKLKEGEMLEKDDKQILINESAAKVFGWDKPVGKWIDMGYGSPSRYIIKGVMKNTYNSAPTMEPAPMIYFYGIVPRSFGHGDKLAICVIFKYREGTWETVKTKIEEIIKKDYPDVTAGNYSIESSKDAYDLFFKTETALLKMLSFLSIVCVLICIFGFVSLISLSCEERRKEIAIRKINGATVLDILNIFFKENFLLLIIGALVAFPIGYYVMRQWLEQYVRQTPIGAWVYLAIIAAMAAVIVMCVGWRVWRASVENPAEVVKMNN